MLVGLAFAAILISSPVAFALSNGTYLLKNANVSDLAGIVITVTATHDGSGNLILKFQLTSNPVVNTPLGIDKIGWNGSENGAVVTDPGCTAPHGWSYDGSGTEDGFGSFTSTMDCPAGDGGISSPIIITFAGNPTITNNTHEAMFVVHIRYNDCSGFVSDGITSVQTETGCTAKPPTPVPEFPLGGILAVAVLAPMVLLLRKAAKVQLN
jgi:hypothetical protein